MNLLPGMGDHLYFLISHGDACMYNYIYHDFSKVLMQFLVNANGPNAKAIQGVQSCVLITESYHKVGRLFLSRPSNHGQDRNYPHGLLSENIPMYF